jgi:hypothetical protein
MPTMCLIIAWGPNNKTADKSPLCVRYQIYLFHIKINTYFSTSFASLSTVGNVIKSFLPFFLNCLSNDTLRIEILWRQISEDTDLQRKEIYSMLTYTAKLMHKYRVFSAQADWTLTHTGHRDTEQSTVTLTDSLLGLPGDTSVCR